MMRARPSPPSASAGPRAPWWAAPLVALCALPCLAQNALDITLLEGAAKVQRSQKRSWEDLAPGRRIYDNDLIETFFQSRVTMLMGPGTALIMGSNTKLLVNVGGAPIGKRAVTALTPTLFAGGAFVKATSGVRVSVYTANAVAQLDSGALSAVVEEKTGETEFLALEGVVSVRAVMQQERVPISAGQTTLVFPGREPTAPLYITTRHVAVLKHFFGDEYIANQLSASGITPSEEKSPDRSRRSFTENLIEKKLAKQQADEAVYKPPISPNKVYGSVLSIQEEQAPGVAPMTRPRRASDSRAEVGVGSRLAVADGSVYPLVWIRPALFFPLGDIGINVFVARDHQGFGAPQFSSSPVGLLSLLEFLDFSVSFGGINRLSVHAGGIEDLTVANGLVVDRLRTANAYSFFDPRGVTLRGLWRWFDGNAFVDDLTAFNYGGGHVLVSAPFGILGAGYYFDRNPCHQLGGMPGARFFEPPDADPSALPDSVVHIYELNAGFDIAQYYNASITLWAEFAQKLTAAGSDGFTVHAPRLAASIHNLSVSAGLLLESGNLMAGTFNAVHPDLRCWSDTLGMVRQPPWLTPDRRSWAATLSCRASPVKGLLIDIGARYDFLASNAIHYHAQDAADTRAFLARVRGLEDTLQSLTYDFSAGISLNDSLWKWMKFAGIYARQVHARYYPVSMRYGGLRGFEAGLDALTAPLMFNVALEAGVRVVALDLAPVSGRPRALTRRDLVPDIYAGLRWGFW